MKDIHQPHDKFVGQLFENEKTAINFLQHYLPPEVLEHVDLSAAKLKKGSFIEQNLKGHFTDVLYQVKLSVGPGYIYLLVEHKSYSDKLTPLQLLRYMVKIWDREIGSIGGGKLPMIIPFVFYHGKSEWRLGTRFGNLLTGPAELQVYSPDFQYALFDLHRYPDDRLAGNPGIQARLFTLKHVTDADFADRLNQIFGMIRVLLARVSEIRNNFFVPSRLV